MAAADLTAGFLAALERRRATGEAVAPDRCAERAVEQMLHWGAARALIPTEPVLDELGVSAAVTAAGIQVVRWPSELGWRELLGLDDAPPTCAITLPVGAVAERGTLLLAASTRQGRSLDAVAWWHLAILPADLILATLALALRAVYGAGGAPPSAVSLVTGPSRTSDVEKITTYGAHGALAEHVIVVGGPDGTGRRPEPI